MYNVWDLRAVLWGLDQFSTLQVYNGSVMSELWVLRCTSESMFYIKPAWVWIHAVL